MATSYEFRLGLTYRLVADTTLHLARVTCVEVCPHDQNSATEAAIFQIVERLPDDSFPVPYLLISRNLQDAAHSGGCGIAYKLHQDCSWEDAVEWDRASIVEDGELAELHARLAVRPRGCWFGGCIAWPIVTFMQFWVERERKRK